MMRELLVATDAAYLIYVSLQGVACVVSVEIKNNNKTPCENVAINKCCMKTIITNRLSFSIKEGEREIYIYI